MTDYTRLLPEHEVKKIGEHDLHLEIFQGTPPHDEETTTKKPPLLFVHGAYTKLTGCGANISPLCPARLDLLCHELEKSLHESGHGHDKDYV